MSRFIYSGVVQQANVPVEGWTFDFTNTFNVSTQYTTPAQTVGKTGTLYITCSMTQVTVIVNGQDTFVIYFGAPEVYLPVQASDTLAFRVQGDGRIFNIYIYEDSPSGTLLDLLTITTID